MRIRDGSSDVCSSDLLQRREGRTVLHRPRGERRADRADHVLAHASGRAALQAEPDEGHDAIRTGGVPEKDRKSVVEGTSVSVSVDLGGRSLITKQNNTSNAMIPHTLTPTKIYK